MDIRIVVPKVNAPIPPFPTEEFQKDARLRAADRRTKYYEAHARCPMCGSSFFSHTLIAYIFDSNNPDAYKDENQFTCRKCKHEGIIHGLMPL